MNVIIINFIKILKSILNRIFRKQGGAEEACWAHNPKVGGSKPPPAI